MTLWKRLFVVMTLTTSCIAHSTIIDNLDNTFKDTSTDNVWMDFGVNNDISFDEVYAQTLVGGVYEGWRLPSATEVYTMWQSVIQGAEIIDVSASSIIADDIRPENDRAGDNRFQAAFDAMGFNLLDTDSNGTTFYNSFGWYKGTDGLSYVQLIDYDLMHNSFKDLDVARLFDNEDLTSKYDSLDYGELENMSTLLVKVANSGGTLASIPEPSVLFLFSFALLGLARKRWL